VGDSSARRKALGYSFVVDCESTQHSLRNAALGERASRGLGDLLTEFGLKGTFFVIPTDLEAHARLYRSLEGAGHEIGVHLHPADLGYEEFCGIYGPQEQRRIIGEATERFTQTMGRPPQSFCMGYASCNDHTFPALVELGYRHGTCSIPTRVLPECVSVWAGAPLDMHYVHRYNRLLPGDLDFVNIPNTVDPESRMWGGKHPQDLRVELVDAKHHWYTIEKAVKRQIRDGTPVPYLQMMTHNIFDYSDPQDFRRQTAIGIIRAAREVAQAHGLEITPATTADLAASYREVVPLSQAGSTRLALDTRGREVSVR
jgi:hypothetical protein